jgi:GNAT superfamily N-acetyltransferase
VEDSEGIARTIENAFLYEHAQMGEAHKCSTQLSVAGATKDFASQISATTDQSFLLVAECEGGIVGFVVCRHDNSMYEGDAEVRELGVLDSHHHRGIGRKLMQGAAEGMLCAGMQSMFVRVWVPSPANGFYVAMGGLPGEPYRGKCGLSVADQRIYRWSDMTKVGGRLR